LPLGTVELGYTIPRRGKKARQRRANAALKREPPPTIPSQVLAGKISSLRGRIKFDRIGILMSDPVSLLQQSNENDGRTGKNPTGMGRVPLTKIAASAFTR